MKLNFVVNAGKGYSSVEDGTLAEDAEKAAQAMGFSTRHQEPEVLPPPPPRRPNYENAEQPATTVHRTMDDDIFEDVGTDYQTQNGSPLSEDMEESPRDGPERLSYFSEPAFGAPPHQMGLEWHQQVRNESLRHLSMLFSSPNEATP